MSTRVHTHPLISIRGSATVQEAARLMTDCSMGAVGVLDDARRFVGILTERDLAWFVAQGSDADETHVREVANDFPVVVDGPIDDASALRRMTEARVRHLIVREEEEYRIVSIRDYIPMLDRIDRAAAADVMTSPPVACRTDAFFEEVAESLADRDISGMPVVEDSGEVVGVISERDLAHALGGPMVRLALRRHNHRPADIELADLPRGGRRARELMTAPAVCVTTETPLDEIARLMREHQINRVPVLDSGRLVGVVTRGDVLGEIGHLEREHSEAVGAPIVVGGRGIDQVVLAGGGAQ